MATNNMAHVRAEMGLEGVGDIVNIRCPSCPFVAVSHAQFSVHALGHLQDRRPAGDHTPATLHRNVLQAGGLGKFYVGVGALQSRIKRAARRRSL